MKNELKFEVTIFTDDEKIQITMTELQELLEKKDQYIKQYIGDWDNPSDYGQTLVNFNTAIEQFTDYLKGFKVKVVDIYEKTFETSVEGREMLEEFVFKHDFETLSKLCRTDRSSVFSLGTKGKSIISQMEEGYYENLLQSYRNNLHTWAIANEVKFDALSPLLNMYLEMKSKGQKVYQTDLYVGHANSRKRWLDFEESKLGVSVSVTGNAELINLFDKFDQWFPNLNAVKYWYYNW